MRSLLIADADPGQRARYGALARHEQLAPLYAADGEEALALLRRGEPPAAVVTELSLPRLDGFALLRAMRAEPDLAKVPALVVSAHRELRDAAAQRRAELGIAGLFARSSPLASLERALRRVLGGDDFDIDVSAFDEPEAAASPAARGAAERGRLAHLAATGLVDDGPPDEALQKLVTDTASAFGVPVALVSLVLEDRQWFKAHVGLQGSMARERGTPRSWSFCRHVVENDAPLVVPDAARHPYFAANPLVAQGLVRGYAGMPLKTPGGFVLGTLCIVDTRPLAASAEELEALRLLARRVAGELQQRDDARKARAELARQVRESELVETALGELEDGVLLFDAARRLVYANQAAARFSGAVPPLLRGIDRDEWVRRMAADAADADETARLLRAPPSGPFAAREELRLAGGERRVLRWTAKPVAMRDGPGQLELLRDITAEDDLARQREQAALTDLLTGLPNRRAAEEQLAREHARSARDGRPLALVLFDIDRFKAVNDARGHAAGDAVLRRVAETLAASARAADLVCRWGGEEFLAVLPGADLAAAAEFAERARLAVERCGDAPAVTVSAGVAETGARENVSDALARADARLYEAKNAGRNRVR